MLFKKKHANRIIILGLAKSGTTILYHIIKNRLPEDTICYFEPGGCDPPEKDKATKHDMLSKVIISSENPEEYGPGACSAFSKKIFIVRDIRDIIVSSFLYSIYNSCIIEDFYKFSSFMVALRQKEIDPKSLSLLELIRIRERLEIFRDRYSPSPFLDYIFKTMETALDVDRLHRGLLYKIKYETAVDGNFGGLEEYLGFTVERSVKVNEQYKRVERTKKYGDWKNWFLPEDVEFFRPRVAEYMETFGYNDKWEVSENPVIPPKNCTVYVNRLAEERHTFGALNYDIEKFHTPDDKVKTDPVEAGFIKTAPYFIDGLSSRNHLEWESHGARIVNPRIETGDGQTVNTLNSGERYIYAYDVIFDRRFESIDFRMMLRSKNGMEIADNGVNEYAPPFASVDAGSKVSVRFGFNCCLTPDIYFFNAGVTRMDGNGRQELLHRVMDAVTFIVRPKVELRHGIFAKPVTRVDMEQ